MPDAAAAQRAAAQRTIDASPFGPWWGFEVDAVGPGRATVRLAARPELYRPGGCCRAAVP